MHSDTQPSQPGNAPASAAARRHLVCTGRDATMLRILARALRAECFDVSEAYDTTDLFDHVVRAFLRGPAWSPIDAVVADARRHSFAALEAVAHLREVDAAVPIVVIVPVHSSAVISEATRAGATSIVRASIPTGELVQILRTVIR